MPQLLVLSCQTGMGTAGSPGSTTRTRGSSAGRDEASGVTWMGCDRHCQHSERDPELSHTERDTRDTKRMAQLPVVPQLTGALCQAALGDTGDTDPGTAPGRLGLQAGMSGSAEGAVQGL